MKLFILCFIFFSCKNDISKANSSSPVDYDTDMASDNLDEYVYIIGKKMGTLNDKDIVQITNFEDMNGKCYKIDKLYKYGMSGAYVYFSNYFDPDGSKILCNFLIEEWREAPSRYVKSSFTLGGRDSLISVFKFRESKDEPESWVCISKTTQDYESFHKGYFVNVFKEYCGNTSCSIEEGYTNSEFKKAMKDVKNYESFVREYKKYPKVE